MLEFKSFVLLGWSGFLSFASGATFDDYSGCVFTLNDSHGISSTYNLSVFHLTDESFLVDDDDIVDWKYRFNVCGSIPSKVWKNNDSVPAYCRTEHGTSDPCKTINSDGTCAETILVTDRAASAVQINEAHEACHWLGVELDSDTMPDFNVSLIDSTDSGSGVVYSILNGQWCGVSGMNRQLNIELICPDSNRFFFDPQEEASAIIEEVVVEYPDCVYTISFESPLACPHNCIDTGSNGEYSVCGTHGVCVADPNYGGSRCICDDGWSGYVCTVETNGADYEVVSTVHTGMIATVVSCIVLLVLAILGALYLCHRIRLKEDMVVGGKTGALAASMLDEDQMGAVMEQTDAAGTSMGIVGGGLKRLQTDAAAVDEEDVQLVHGDVADDGNVAAQQLQQQRDGVVVEEEDVVPPQDDDEQVDAGAAENGVDEEQGDANDAEQGNDENDLLGMES